MDRMKCFVYLVVCMVFVIFSCKEKDRKPKLFYTVTSFSAPVTSISQSLLNDSILFIGFENGNVVIKNTYTDRQTVLNVGSNRVYDVKEYSDDVFLVGIRDEGLKIVRLFDNDRSEIIKTCAIAGKGTNYGVYSIARKDADNFILGTSNGCYTLRLSNNIDADTVKPYNNTLCSPRYYGFNKVLCIDDKEYMAYDSALLVGHKGDVLCNFLPGKSIVNMFRKGNLLYISTRNSGVWTKDITNLDNVFRHESSHSSYAYMKDTLDGTWIVENDKISYRPPQSDMSIDYKIPQGVSISGKQTVCADENFVFLACGHQLFTFPLHQNIYGEKGSVVALCRDHDSDAIYFVSGDYNLYKYQKKPAENSVARLQGKINGLKIQDNIIQSYVRNGIFWIATDKTLFKIDISTGKLLKSISINPSKQSQNDIRCLFYDNDTTLYAGSRFHLHVINPSKDDTLRPYDKLKNTHNDLYVTALCRIADTLYVGTLNKGLFAVIENHTVDTLLSEGHRYGNIRNLVIEDARLYVHTSKNIYRYIAKDSMCALSNISLNSSKYIRSLISDTLSHTVAIIGNHGFTQLNCLSKDSCNKLLYRDISFNNATIAFLDDASLIVGNRSGLYHYNGKNLFSISVETEKFFPWTQHIIWLSTFCLIIILIRSIIKNQRRRLNKFLEKIATVLFFVEKQILDESEKEKLRSDFENMEKEIIAVLRKNFIWFHEVNHLFDKLSVLERTTYEAAGDIKKLEESIQQLKADIAGVINEKQSITDEKQKWLAEHENLKQIITSSVEEIKADMNNIHVPKANADLTNERENIMTALNALDCNEIMLENIHSYVEKIETLKRKILFLKQKLEQSIKELQQISQNEGVRAVAERLGIDNVDLEIIEVLADPNHEKRQYYLSIHAGMTETRQSNIADSLGCPNRRYYIVSAAYIAGLLQP
jgi:hypothetical protein